MQSVKLDPCCSAVVKVQLTPHTSKKAPVYVECDPDLEARTGLTATDAMFAHAEDGTAEIVVTNPTPLPQMVEEHTNLGAATPAWVAAHCYHTQGRKGVKKIWTHWWLMTCLLWSPQ